MELLLCRLLDLDLRSCAGVDLGGVPHRARRDIGDVDSRRTERAMHGLGDGDSSRCILARRDCGMLHPAEVRERT